MTAIAAVFAPGGNPSALGVTGMLDAAPHRGACPPAWWRSGACVLGWRASAGRQGIARRPFAAGPNDTGIVFDGRLDNADDLRRALDAGPEAGDAALALAAYAKWSDEAAAHLLGDFAFAVWDGPRRRLFCARDALGQRSLFFGCAGGVTLVASEPQQILAYPGFPAVVNEGIVAEYLTARPASADDTIWNGLSRLRPAHTLLVTESALRRQRFWEFDLDAHLEYGRDEEYAEHFMAVFRDAIECRTRDASEVGIFLSGGVDSSAIAGVAESMARERGAGPLRADSMTFP
jgi:asparagine synthase (glutamine-hydrolysing)